MKIKDIMTRDVITVTRETTIKEVARLLVSHKVSGLPVVDENGKVIGVVSEGDLIYQDMKLHTPAFLEILGGIIYLENPQRLGHDLMKMTASKVGAIMTSKVFTINEDASVSDAATLMIEKKVNRLPVVDKEGKLVGIVTRQDLIKTMI